jgi:hypothetical protein
MSIIQNIASRVFKLNLPYSPSGYSNIDDSENIGWIPLTTGNREIPVYHQDKMFQIATYLYRKNTLGHRIVEVIKSFVVGEGIYVKARDPEVDKVIQKFWSDRRNNFKKHLRERVVSQSLYGESLWPAYVNTMDGSVILGNNHPSIIEKVFPNLRNNFEAETIITKKGVDARGNPVEPQELQVIKQDNDIDSPSFGFYQGDVFFFAINKPMENLRGVSDLYSIADWMDIYDQFMFNRAQRQSHMNEYIWDIEMEGASKQEIDKKAAELILREKKQRSGRFYIHNEKERRKAVSPDMHSEDAQTDAQSLLQVIFGGSGLSAQAFGDPSGAGRQASGEVNEWIFKTLSDRQFTWRDILQDVIDFVIDQAILHEVLNKNVDRFIEIFMPKISIRDLQRLTQSLRNMGTFINQISKAEGYIELDAHDKHRLKKVMHTLLDHIDQSSGIEMLHDIRTGTVRSDNEDSKEDNDETDEKNNVSESLDEFIDRMQLSLDNTITSQNDRLNILYNQINDKLISTDDDVHKISEKLDEFITTGAKSTRRRITKKIENNADGFPTKIEEIQEDD